MHAHSALSFTALKTANTFLAKGGNGGAGVGLPSHIVAVGIGVWNDERLRVKVSAFA